MGITIKKAEIIHVQLPLIEKFEISSGFVEKKDSIIVKLYTDDFIGYGDSPPMPAPFYSSETPFTCLHIIKDFIVPSLSGRSFEKIEDVSDIFVNIRGNNFAKAGVEMALWDLMAKYTNKPLYKYIGGQKKDIPWKISIGIKKDIKTLLDTVGSFLNKGLSSIKMKIRKGWDLGPVEAIRKRFGDISLSVDANSFYSIEDIDLFKELDNYGLTQIEQPLSYDDLYDHYRLRDSINTPICLDESIHSVTAARNAMDMGCCDIVNIKVQRVGGIRNAIVIHDICKDNDIPVWIGCMPDSGIGHAAGLVMCSLPNVRYPSDIPPTGAYFKKDIIEPEIKTIRGGYLELLEGPGLGCKLKEKTLNELKISSFDLNL
jgi:O-succinylbenzoate synthase